MKVKLTKTEDSYPMMKSWWEGHGFPSVAPSTLPESTFVCYNDKDEPVYSMCFYNTDSDLCWLAWQISNPEISKADTKGCFDYLFKAVEAYAKHLEYTVILTTSATSSVVKTLTDNGYAKGDTEVSHYIKNI
jgi:hypothetical protein